MKLLLVKLAGALVLQWRVPSSGTCYLMATSDHIHYLVAMSFHSAGNEHASFWVPTAEQAEFFSVEFHPDEL